MHHAIFELAQKLGTQIVERDAWATWLYDGKTIASYYLICPDPRDPFGSEDWFAPKCVQYTATDLLHELGHLQASAVEQRDLPEYGLAMGIASGSGYGPNGGEFRQLNGLLKNFPHPYKIFDGLVDEEEQEIQEILAQLWSVYWGQTYAIKFDMSDWKNLPNNWEFYFRYKITQSYGKEHSVESLRRTWIALIRFREAIAEGKG